MDIVVGALVGGCFKFPEGTELVSTVYAVSFSKTFYNLIKLASNIVSHWRMSNKLSN